jgi:hypothetical protein
MTVKSEIRTKLEKIMTAGEATACNIYKGHGYTGSIEADGWFYVPFGRQPVYLGKNKAEAMETIEQIREARAEGVW